MLKTSLTTVTHSKDDSRRKNAPNCNEYNSDRIILLLEKSHHQILLLFKIILLLDRVNIGESIIRSFYKGS
jgi:hypothetical protein